MSEIKNIGCELTRQQKLKFTYNGRKYPIRAGLDNDGVIWFPADDLRIALGKTTSKIIIALTNEKHTRIIRMHGENLIIKRYYSILGINALGLLQIMRKINTPRANALWQWYKQTVMPALLEDNTKSAAQDTKQLTFDDAVKPEARQYTFIFNGEYQIRTMLDDDKNIWLIANDVITALRQSNAGHIGIRTLRQNIPNKQFKPVTWHYNHLHKATAIHAINKQGLQGLIKKRLRSDNTNKSAIAAQFWQWYLDIVEPAILVADAKPDVQETKQVEPKAATDRDNELIISKIKLQPCPECSSQPVIKAGRTVSAEGKAEHYCAVECPSCRFTVMERGTSPQKAMQSWNEAAAKLTEPKLNPCPFCGGEAKVIGRGKYSDYLAKCLSCGATSEYKGTPEEAAETWNRRIEHERD